MKYSIAIWDDQKSIVSILCKYIKRICEELNLDIDVEKYQNPQELINKITEYPTKFHIVLLDVDMLEINGLDVAKIIKKYNKHILIIFITAHSNYAVKAFEVRAFNYLMKPINQEKLKEVILESIRVTNLINNQLHQGKITITNNGTIINIPFNKIIYIEKYKNKVRIICNETEYEYYTTFKKLKKILSKDIFVQCHQGYIIQKNKIIGYYDKALLLENNKKIPVSKNHEKKVKEIFCETLRCNI